MIYVCPLSRIEETVLQTGAGHLLSLLSEGTLVTRPRSIAEANHLWLKLHDIAEAQEGMTPPGMDHVAAVLAFARRWDRSRPVVVHCFAGISRSTASAYIMAAALSPQRDEAELAAALRTASPTATPNARLIALADAALGRNGRMIEAIRGIGRGADAFEGIPFRFDP